MLPKRGTSLFLSSSQTPEQRRPKRNGCARAIAPLKRKGSSSPSSFALASAYPHSAGFRAWKPLQTVPSPTRRTFRAPPLLIRPLSSGAVQSHLRGEERERCSAKPHIARHTAGVNAAAAAGCLQQPRKGGKSAGHGVLYKLTRAGARVHCFLYFAFTSSPVRGMCLIHSALRVKAAGRFPSPVKC